MRLARLHADKHEAAAAEVARLRKDDGEGKSNGDGCVHRIAAGFEHFDACVGGVVVDADHHRVPGQRGRRADDGVRVGCGGRSDCLDACLGRNGRAGEGQSDAAGGKTGTVTH